MKDTGLKLVTEASVMGATAPPIFDSPAPSIGRNLDTWAHKQKPTGLALFGLVLVLGYMMDWGVRRRTGGHSY